MNSRHLKALAALATGNRELICTAGAAICTNCGERVLTEQITEWLDDRKLDDVDELTAVCPKCKADAMLPDMATELVRAIHNHWFK